MEPTRRLNNEKVSLFLGILINHIAVFPLYFREKDRESAVEQHGF
jgi:hypothetical protein